VPDRNSRGPGLDGILVVGKPPGPTSHDVVALIRRLAATRRVGHGGTLDPFAGGVLPIFLGRATRVVEYHLGDRKRYQATVCFGASSTTDDLEGGLTPAAGPAPVRATVEAALVPLTGRITQRPPAYSAIRVAGRRAYALARAGQQVELDPREVQIHRFDIVSWDDADPDRPIAIVDVECSAGTYVRALARDLGEAVGSAAYLGALERTASGPFIIQDAIRLDQIRALAADGPDALRTHLLPIDFGLDAFPVVPLDDGEVAAITRGQLIRPAAPIDEIDAKHVRLMARDGSLVAIAVPRGDRLAPDKVFASVTDGTSGRPLGANAMLATELDPPVEVDPDPATPDDD
jgi:tRNA pseudouridine55 synthase